MSRLHQLVAAAVAIACLIVALPARATLGQQCEAELASMAPDTSPHPPVADEGWMVCDGEVVVVVAEISHREIPMCSTEGTSTIAPLPIHPVDGAAAEAVANCDQPDGPDEWARGSDDQRVQIDISVQLDANVVAAPAPLPTAAPLTTITLSDDGAPRRGFDAGVFRPPRR